MAILEVGVGETEGLYLGETLDGSGAFRLDPDHLTTHAVCLGMTGSGKTGLGVVMLEELARRGVPLLVVDLKGDMVNLLLTFPSLAAADFEPWLAPDAAAAEDRPARAAQEAAKWRNGLERHGLGPADIEAVRNGVRWRLVTPGVASLAPLDILPALAVPAGWDPQGDPDAAADRVAGVTSALLSLVGRGGDPFSDRDHVLTSNLLLEHWRRGESLDLPGLLKSIADPPLETLGALPLEAFYPRSERMKLVLELNTLLASPSFAAWTTGEPLTMDHLLGGRSSPCATILTVAHLDTRERLFALGLVFSELVAWMRRQPASSGLRALLYVDEMQGIAPPYPANPPPKGPLLTLLKQGRAFGVGAWLATQNPVDLDYKALGNAGIKVVGRLITDRDRDRALEGLGMSSLPDGRDADQVVAGLGKREFLLDDVRAKPRVSSFATRWAMSYLRGPVSLAELRGLVAEGGGKRADERPQPVPAQHAGPPVLAGDLPQRFEVVARGLARPALMVRVRVRVASTKAALDRTREEVWRAPVADGGIDWERAEELGREPETAAQPPDGMTFPAAAPLGPGGDAATLQREFVAWRAARPETVLANLQLKLAADAEEGRQAFLDRCLEAADRADDAVQERSRRRYEARMQTLRRRLEREQGELARDRDQLGSRKAEEVLGVVESLFSVLVGSRSVRSASSKAATRLRGAMGRRRMRQRAGAEVEESEREIERLQDELEDLADQLQEEVDRIAADSDAAARRIEELSIRPKRADVAVRDVVLLWS